MRKVVLLMALAAVPACEFIYDTEELVWPGADAGVQNDAAVWKDAGGDTGEDAGVREDGGQDGSIPEDGGGDASVVEDGGSSDAGACDCTKPCADDGCGTVCGEEKLCGPGTVCGAETPNVCGSIEGIENPLKAVAGTSWNDIWAVGLRATVLHFDGAQWSRIDTGLDTDDDFNAVIAGDPVLISAARFDGTEPRIIRRDSSGWTLAYEPPAYVHAMAAAGDERWAACNSGTVLRWSSQDGKFEPFAGPQFSSAPPPDLLSIGILSSDGVGSQIFVGDSEGKIWRWRDTWSSESREQPINFIAGGSGYAWAVGESALVQRFAGGSWASAQPQGSSPRAVWALNSARAWVVGMSGTFLDCRVEDGSLQCYPFANQPGVATDLYGIWGIASGNEVRLVAVGSTFVGVTSYATILMETVSLATTE